MEFLKTYSSKKEVVIKNLDQLFEFLNSMEDGDTKTLNFKNYKFKIYRTQNSFSKTSDPQSWIVYPCKFNSKGSSISQALISSNNLNSVLKSINTYYERQGL